MELKYHLENFTSNFDSNVVFYVHILTSTKNKTYRFRSFFSTSPSRDATSQKSRIANIFRPDNGHVFYFYGQGGEASGFYQLDL